MANKKITDEVYSLAEKKAKDLNLGVYEVEYKKEGTDMVLRVVLDTLTDEKDDVVSIDKCESISRFLSDELDCADLIDKAYMLEVTSPGLDRPLKKDEDYTRFNGRKIDIGLYKAVDGSKTLTGTLCGYDGENITILPDGSDEKLVISKNQTAFVKLAVIF